MRLERPPSSHPSPLPDKTCTGHRLGEQNRTKQKPQYNSRRKTEMRNQRAKTIVSGWASLIYDCMPPRRISFVRGFIVRRAGVCRKKKEKKKGALNKTPMYLVRRNARGWFPGSTRRNLKKKKHSSGE